jgi:hypothetical protein
MTAEFGDKDLRLYGRDLLIERLARSHAPVSILTGDTGIGKSAVLVGAQRLSAAGSVAPPPRTLARSGGVLQSGFLLSLGDAVASLITEDGAAQRTAGIIVDAARRLAAEEGRALATVIAGELLTIVRARLGPGVGDALVSYIGDLKTSVDEQLAGRISAGVDPAVMETLGGFAREVSDLAGDREVFLALDSAERLREDDLPLLADLAEGLPNNLHLRLALSTYNLVQHRRAQHLDTESPQIAIFEVLPLEVGAVAEWMRAEGLEAAEASRVLRLSGGYGLHCGDLIAHLERGGEIEEAPMDKQFARRTREAWASLDPVTAAVARAISVFIDPLPGERLERFLKLGPHQRGEFEDRLVAARIFSVEVNGRRWFHEQRRSFIVDELLDDDERASASAKAAEELLRMYEDGAESRLGEIARLIAAAPTMTADDEGLAAMVALDRAELAIAASLIELTDKRTENPAQSGDELLTYAMAVFGVKGDLVQAVRRLRDRGLLVIVGDDRRTAVVPYGWSHRMGVVASGRAEWELRRRPIPEVGSAVFSSEVVPRLGRFRKAFYGLGRPDFTKLSHQAREMSEPEGGLIVVGNQFDPSLLLRVSHSGRPMNVVATFGSEDVRDEALARLSGLETTAMGDPLEVTDALSYPARPVPSRRFVAPLAAALGSGLSGVPRLALEDPIPIEVEIARRAETLRVIRGLCDGAEAQALGVEIASGLSWYRRDGGIVEVEIRGGREGSERIEADPDLDWDRPFSLFELVRRLDLEPDEWIGSQHFRSSGEPIRFDPVVDTVAKIAKRASEFNRAQAGPLTVRLEERPLGTLIHSALARRLEDGRALCRLPIDAELSAPRPWAVHLAVVNNEDPALGPRGTEVVWAGIPVADDLETVSVVIAERAEVGGGAAALRRIFDVDLTTADGAGIGSADHVLAGLLGYDIGEIQLC